MRAYSTQYGRLALYSGILGGGECQWHNLSVPTSARQKTHPGRRRTNTTDGRSRQSEAALTEIAAVPSVGVGRRLSEAPAISASLVVEEVIAEVAAILSSDVDEAEREPTAIQAERQPIPSAATVAGLIPAPRARKSMHALLLRLWDLVLPFAPNSNQEEL